MGIMLNQTSVIFVQLPMPDERTCRLTIPYVEASVKVVGKDAFTHTFTTKQLRFDCVEVVERQY